MCRLKASVHLAALHENSHDFTLLLHWVVPGAVGEVLSALKGRAS